MPSFPSYLQGLTANNHHTLFTPFFFFFQLRKQKPGEMKPLAQSHTVSTSAEDAQFFQLITAAGMQQPGPGPLSSSFPNRALG